MLAALVMSVSTGCSKDEDDDGSDNSGDNNTTTQSKSLVIENGAQVIAPDGSLTYTAYLVDANGNMEAVSPTWSVSDEKVATISSSGAITVVGQGGATVTATVSSGGATYTAQVPIGIYPPSVFVVSPSAIIYEAGWDLQLETVYLSPSAASATYTYSSSDESVATVSSTGLVSFVGAGECTISVKGPEDVTVNVPVLVLGEAKAALPITKVKVTPATADIFKAGTQTYTAKAYDAEGTEKEATFTWSSSDTEVATVDANGKVTGVSVGMASIYATANGIKGQTEVYVMPDRIVIIDPISVSIAPGKSKQLTAKVWDCKNETYLTDNFTLVWETPEYPIDLLNVGTVDQSGNFTVKSSATPGMMTPVACMIQGEEESTGIAQVMVAMAGLDCECGNDVEGVSDITVTSSSVSMSMMDMGVDLGAKAVDANGNEVSGVTLNYCTDNATVANVVDGTVQPAGMAGTANITICVGSVSTTVEVTVSSGMQTASCITV